jgi:transposase
MDRLEVSAAERTILEALAVSPDLPAIQARAEVVLRAAKGLDEDQIAAEVLMRRKDVIHWEKRFKTRGIHGLWDPPGPGPKKRVSPETERAVLWDVLYVASGMHWDARLLAQKHGLNRSAVYRIWDKHGIVRGKFGLVKIGHLKIFQDPLFGVSVSGIAGLYYGASGVLALTSTRRPLSELCFSANNAAAQQAGDGLIAELRKVAEFRKLDPRIVAEHAAELEGYFLCWLNAIEDWRESNSEVHLLAGLPTSAPQGATGVQQWLAEHPDFQMHYAPMAAGLPWVDFVQRCFVIIAALPVQARLVEDVQWITGELAAIPDQDWLARSFVAKQRVEEKKPSENL